MLTLNKLSPRDKAELRGAIEKETQITREYQVNKLEEIAEDAKGRGKYSAAVYARRTQSELLGHFERCEGGAVGQLAPRIIVFCDPTTNARRKQIESKEVENE